MLSHLFPQQYQTTNFISTLWCSSVRVSIEAHSESSFYVLFLWESSSPAFFLAQCQSFWVAQGSAVACVCVCILCVFSDSRFSCHVCVCSNVFFRIARGWGRGRLLKCSTERINKKFTTNFESSSAAAAAKSLQSCPILWDPIDGSPPGSPVPGILQVRTLEWVDYIRMWSLLMGPPNVIVARQTRMRNKKSYTDFHEC